MCEKKNSEDLVFNFCTSSEMLFQQSKCNEEEKSACSCRPKRQSQRNRRSCILANRHTDFWSRNVLFSAQNCLSRMCRAERRKKITWRQCTRDSLDHSVKMAAAPQWVEFSALRQRWEWYEIVFIRDRYSVVMFYFPCIVALWLFAELRAALILKPLIVPLLLSLWACNVRKMSWSQLL